MELCLLCRSIPFDHIPPRPEFLKWQLYLGPGLCFVDPPLTPGFTRPSTFGLPYHQNLHSLKHSAKACMLCSLVHDEVQQFIQKVHHGERIGNNGNLFKYDKPKRYCFQITKRADQEGFVIWTDEGPNARVWYVAVFGYSVDGGKHTKQTAPS